LAELSSVSGYLSGTINSITKAVFAFYIIALISSGVAMFGSLVAIFLTTSRILLYANLGFAILGNGFLLAASIIVTAMTTIIANLVNSLGSSIGVSATTGAKFLILTWVSWVLLLLVNCYWFAVWYVEVKSWALQLRTRTEAQIGNWGGVFQEIKGNFKRE
jgi:hypothetical protein